MSEKLASIPRTELTEIIRAAIYRYLNYSKLTVEVEIPDHINKVSQDSATYNYRIKGPNGIVYSKDHGISEDQRRFIMAELRKLDVVINELTKGMGIDAKTIIV